LRHWRDLGGAGDAYHLAVLWGADCYFVLGDLCASIFLVVAELDDEITVFLPSIRNGGGYHIKCKVKAYLSLNLFFCFNLMTSFLS
jgi:hypothetical protein